MTGKHRLPDRRKRTVENDDYAAMLHRMHLGLATRIAEDPTMLAHEDALKKSLFDAFNAGIAAANRKPDQPYSLAEIAAIAGVSRQAIHKRVRFGETVLAAVAAARARGGVVRLADIRATRTARLAEAGIPDRATSPKELTTGESA